MPRRRGFLFLPSQSLRASSPKGRAIVLTAFKVGCNKTCLKPSNSDLSVTSPSGDCNRQKPKATRASAARRPGPDLSVCSLVLIPKTKKTDAVGLENFPIKRGRLRGGLGEPLSAKPCLPAVADRRKTIKSVTGIEGDRSRTKMLTFTGIHGKVCQRCYTLPLLL